MDSKFMLKNKSRKLLRVKVMQSTTHRADGWPGWIDGTFDSPIARGESVDAVTVTFWFYTRKSSVK